MRNLVAHNPLTGSTRGNIGAVGPSNIGAYQGKPFEVKQRLAGTKKPKQTDLNELLAFCNELVQLLADISLFLKDAAK